MMDWAGLSELRPAKCLLIVLANWMLSVALSGWYPAPVYVVQDVKRWHGCAVTERLAETSSLRGILGVSAPGTTSASSRRICLHSPPHHSEMSALSSAASPSLSFILTLTAPSLPELHRRQVRFFFTPRLVGSSFSRCARHSCFQPSPWDVLAWTSERAAAWWWRSLWR